MESLQHINDLLTSNSIEEALAAACEAVEKTPGDAVALYTRGKIYWRLGRKAEAMTDYTASSIIDPEGPGAIALQHAQEVVHYFNPDLFNP